MLKKRLLLGLAVCSVVIIGALQYKKNLITTPLISQEKSSFEQSTHTSSNQLQLRSIEDLDGVPIVDRVNELFDINQSKLPIVKTIRYTSRAKWLPGKSAWLSDYASHFKTSKHFIARSVNGKPSYQNQLLHQGDKFNVYNDKIEFEYHIVVDLSRSRAWLYYYDQTADENVLLKTYLVGLGRLDSQKKSGLLTPTGTYKLGDKIATYKPKKYDHYKGNSVEMIKVFGTRWIPFEKGIGDSESYEGLGLHGCPWQQNSSNELVENRSLLGKYTTDGCIHFAQEDIEEIYAIVVTKPTFVHIVKDFHEAKLPTRSKI